MAWVSLTEADVRTRLSSAELAAVNSVHAASGDTTLVASLITQVTDEIRGYVAAWPENKLEEGAKIPSKLVGAALAIIRYRILSSLPSQTLLTEARKKESDDALRLLERVSEGKFRVEDPVTVSAETIAAAKPRFTAKTLTHRRSDADGI